MNAGLYEVTHHRSYRGHAPGTRFEARIPESAERRAIARGTIRKLKPTTPSLQPGSYRFPTGWLPQEEGSNG